MMQRAFFIIGLGFGDEGKGTITDYLARELAPHTVVRFNGGPQAAHHVITSDNILHCFSQFGSGTFVPGVETVLSRFMLIDPPAMEQEAAALKDRGIDDPLARIIIDEQALVITPFQKIINRMLETFRGDARHGSCGRGVGQTILDAQYLKSRALFAGDLKDQLKMREKLKFIWQLKLDLAGQLISEQPDNQSLQRYYHQLREENFLDRTTEAYYQFANQRGVRIVNSPLLNCLARPGTVLFEGAQGLLLDVEYGFWPHVTKTRTTFHNAEILCREADYQGEIIRLGVLRAYATRHGAGPFVTEDEQLSATIPDLHNQTNEWQRDFKIGWFDLVLAKYAIEIAGAIDGSLAGIALTNIDRWKIIDNNQICVAYQYCGEQSELLDQFFHYQIVDERVIIDRIKFVEKPDQARQNQLMKLLCECRPIYQNITKIDCLKKFLDDENLNNYLNYLWQNLAVPIKIISTGPRSDNKHWIKE